MYISFSSFPDEKSYICVHHLYHTSTDLGFSETFLRVENHTDTAKENVKLTRFSTGI